MFVCVNVRVCVFLTVGQESPLVRVSLRVCMCTCVPLNGSARNHLVPLPSPPPSPLITPPPAPNSFFPLPPHSLVTNFTYILFPPRLPSHTHIPPPISPQPPTHMFSSLPSPLFLYILKRGISSFPLLGGLSACVSALALALSLALLFVCACPHTHVHPSKSESKSKGTSKKQERECVCERARAHGGIFYFFSC